MVRSASAVRSARGTPVSTSPESARRALRKLMDENRRLRRELSDLRRLERRAHEDPLTRLPNRRLFDERLREELLRASRDRSLRGSVLVADVDDLKALNDRLGHAAGDELLRELARVLRQGVREADLCCRAGGDEFLILLSDTDAAGARLVMNRLRAALFALGARRDAPVGLSLGSATWPADGTSVSKLIGVADAAMYADKRRLRSLGLRRPRGRRALTLVK